MIDPARGLKNLPVPPLPAGLGDRVLASRAAGVRTHLPVVDGNRRVRPGFLAVAVVLAIVLLAMVNVLSPRTTAYQPANSAFGGDPFFFPQQAFAQQPGWTPPAPKFPLVTASGRSQLTEGRWRWWAQTIGLGGEIERTMTVVRSSRNTWLVVVGIRGPYSWTNIDSIWVDASTLTPSRLHRRAGRSRYTTVEIGADSVVSTHSERVRPRSSRTTPLPPGPRAAVLPSGFNLLRVLLGTFPLHGTWQGSMYSVPPPLIDGRAQFIPVNLRVVGEGTVTVPAGTFECWQVFVEHLGHPLSGTTIWVAKRGGWIVRMTSPTSQWPDEVLLSYEPRP